jgi:hypothetical protein
MTAAQLADRERALSAFPDHPDHRVLEAERRRQEQGYDEEVIDLWTRGPGDWRRSQTLSWSEGKFDDIVVTPSNVWSMTADSLTVLEPGAPPPPGRDLPSLEDGLSQWLRLIRDGNLGLGVRAEARPTGFRPVEGGMEMVVTAPTGLHTSYVLAGVEGTDLPVVVQFTRHEKLPSNAVRDRWRFSQWRFVPHLERPIAMRAERVDEQGRVLESLDVVEIRAAAPGEFARVTAMPIAAGTDPLRGPVTFRSVFDFRADANTITSITPEGSVLTAIPPEMLPPKSSTALRTAGWITAAGLLAALIGVRLMRGRRRGVAAIDP